MYRPEQDNAINKLAARSDAKVLSGNGIQNSRWRWRLGPAHLPNLPHQEKLITMTQKYNTDYNDQQEPTVAKSS